MSDWIDIDLEFVKSSNVDTIQGGYKLNGGHVEADTNLVGVQQNVKYGFIFIIKNLEENVFTENKCELVFYNEDGSMLDSTRLCMPITRDLEGVTTWKYVTVPRKTYRIEYIFRGRYEVTAIQLFAVSENVTVNVATYENTGIVKPEQEKGIYVEADGRIGVNASKVIDNSLKTTSKNITGAVNEIFFCLDDMQNTYESTILSCGGTVEKTGTIATKTQIDDGIRSIKKGGGGGSSPPIGTEGVGLKAGLCTFGYEPFYPNFRITSFIAVKEINQYAGGDE